MGVKINMPFPFQQTQFISGDPVMFSCSNMVNSSLNDLCLWTVKDTNFPNDISTVTPNQAIGAAITINALPKPLIITQTYTGIGRGYPLIYEIKATLTADNDLDYNTIVISQDNLSELRQEYRDFSVPDVPGRDEFDQWVPQGLFARLLNRGNASGVCQRHDYWIVFNLEVKAGSVNIGYFYEYSSNINFTSGYRCPAGNGRSGGAARSIHMQGKAFDWGQVDSITNWQVARSMESNMENNNVSAIFLYDQYNIIYSDIPDTYEQRQKTTTNPKTGEIVELVYTHGHADWGEGF